jgi:two-component system response regulator FlrC
MKSILCVTDNLADSEAWMMHLHQRGYDTHSVTLAKLMAMEVPWQQAGLLMSKPVADKLTSTAASFGNVCRKLKLDRAVIINEYGNEFGVKSLFNGTTLSIVPKQGDWRFTTELVSRFFDPDQDTAVGDPATYNLLRLASKVAASEVTVLLVGPTGSGKEVISKFIHANSPRKAAPFIALNCAAVPDTMLEALLFGYERGAFTGAHHPNKGIFRAADGGTLLLDEVSEMALPLQAKLLRVLQEKEVTPLGAAKSMPVDVRVIATSNRLMMDEVKAGRFREDLYYRLNVFPLTTRSLSERPGDILPIAISLLSKHAGGFAKMPDISIDAIEKLEAYQWPGNVRELENVLQRALVLSSGETITSDHLMIEMEDFVTPHILPARPLQLAV